jgi:hypothetical protein
MVHAVAYIIFILPFTAWLGFELNKKYSLRAHWKWIMAAAVLGIIGSYIQANIFPDKFGNFLLHASGGISATLLFVYLFRTLNLHFNWRMTLVLLFAFTCMVGVLNELAEYFFELLGFDVFSFDTHDTWRDFVANSTGMLVAWAALLVTQQLGKR